VQTIVKTLGHKSAEMSMTYSHLADERVTRELKRQGLEVGRHRVARLMRERGLAGITRRKRQNLTRPDSAAAAAAIPDLLRREFTAPMPGLKLIGDNNCFPTGEGWLYLATVLDLCSKELIGYAVAHTATRYSAWTSGKAPAGPARAPTAPRPSRSSPR
jgi:transposase InsO family protein